MALSLDSFKKPQAGRPPRIILLGTEKVGKSTFAAGAPAPVFIPVKGETGIDELNVDCSDPVASYDEVIGLLGLLYESEHPYKTVVIDSSSALEPLVVATAMRREGVESQSKLGGGYGHQDDTPLAMWRQITEGLDALRDDRGMASIVIGHVTVKPFSDPLTETYDAFEWDVRAKLRNMLFRWADCILFANRKAYITKEEAGFNKKTKRGVSDDARYLYTQKRPGHPGGGRGVYGHLPYEIPLKWSAFQDAVLNAQSKTESEQK